MEQSDLDARKEFTKLMNDMANFYSHFGIKMTGQRLDSYWESLRKYSIGRISDAINEHTKDPDHCNRFPLPGDIIRQIPNEKNLGRNCKYPRQHTAATCDCTPALPEPPPDSNRLPVCFDPTKPRAERLIHINALLAMSDDELQDQGYKRAGLTFLRGMMDKVAGDDDLLRDRLRRRHGLEPLIPNTERDALRADYQAARAKGDYDTAVELVGRLVDGMEHIPDPNLRPAHEGMMDPGMAAEIRDGLNMPKPKRARTTKGGAQDKTTT